MSANVDQGDAVGRTPLFLSCMSSNSVDAFPEVAALLIEFGADIEHPMAGCNPGATPLYASAIHEQPRAVPLDRPAAHDRGRADPAAELDERLPPLHP